MKRVIVMGQGGEARGVGTAPIVYSQNAGFLMADNKLL